MSVAELVLEYFKTLVWPAVVAGILIGYRGTAQQVLARLTQIDAPGISATFDMEIRQATEIATPPSPATDDNPNPPHPDTVAIKPTSFAEMRIVGEKYRSGCSVLLNLSELDPEIAKRMVDFSAGLVFQSSGFLERMADRVFVLTPGLADSTTPEEL